MSAKKVDKKDKKVSIQEPPPRPKPTPDSLTSPPAPPAVSTRLSVIAPPKFVSLVWFTREYGFLGERSQISTNHKRESTVFSLLIDQEIWDLPYSIHPVKCKIRIGNSIIDRYTY